jgi:hypothetical protein
VDFHIWKFQSWLSTTIHCLLSLVAPCFFKTQYLYFWDRVAFLLYHEIQYLTTSGFPVHSFTFCTRIPPSQSHHIISSSWSALVVSSNLYRLFVFLAPFLRSYVLIFLQNRICHLRGRLFPVSPSGPRTVSVMARTMKLSSGKEIRFPIVESVMDGSTTQPYIHDTTVTIILGTRGSTSIRFDVFYRRHERLPLNRSIQERVSRDNRYVLRGDLLVMKLGSGDRGDRVVSMSPTDVLMADFAASL